MKTFDHVPKWLAEDDHAVALLRDGWDLDAVVSVVERAAIYRHDAGSGDLEAEFKATIDFIHHAPKDKIRKTP